MQEKAPRIPDATWDQYREEIVAFYFARKNSLEHTMKYMAEKHDFRPTRNQYHRKLKLWSVKKYNSSIEWSMVATAKRKRSQEGKDSDWVIHGRKYSRRTVDKEIARHVPLSSICSSSENVQLPDYITVSTPRDDLTGISRELLLRNLPWHQCIQELRSLFPYELQKSIHPSTPATSLDLLAKEISLQSSNDLPQLSIAPRYPKMDRQLQTYLPPEDLETRDSVAGNLRSLQKGSSFSVLEDFLKRLVYLSTNNLLDQLNSDKVYNWIVSKCGPDFLVYLCRLRSPSIRIFARKVFGSVVESGDASLARKILCCGTQIQGDPSQSSQWAKYLSLAVYHGHEAMVELLCEAGVPPKVNCEWRWEDKWDSHLPILAILLRFGANPETFIPPKEAGYPLIDAARSGSLQAVVLLVNAGARVDLYVPRERATALRAAVWGGHLEVVRYLIHRGADINVPNVNHLQHLQGMFLDSRDFLSPVQIAAKLGNLPLLQILLEHGAPAAAYLFPAWLEKARRRLYQNVDGLPHFSSCECCREYKIHTPLQYGVESQNVEVVKLLLSTGVSPDARVAGIGDTPLQMSARLGNLALFQLLLRYGADVNAPPSAFYGCTALQGAAESGSWEIVSMLLEAGAQVNAPPAAEYGMTALQAACLGGHSLTVGCLLTHKADLSAVPSSVGGLTPIQAAAKHGDIGLVRQLINLGADADAPATEVGTTALLAATEHESLPLLKILVHHGASVNPSPDHILNSPLTEAAAGNWLEGVEFLLEHGAEVNNTPFELMASRDIDELRSPLGWAIYNTSEDMIILLLQYGADVLSTVYCSYRDSQSALMFALDSLPFQGENLGILDLLFAQVPNLEKHPGWENALSHVLGHAENAIEVCDWVIDKASSLTSSLRHTVIQKGWDIMPLSRFGGFHEEEKLLDLVESLSMSGADIDSRNEDRDTILQRMARGRYYECCSFLVHHGADINTHATHYLGTPLQEAVRNEDVKMTHLFLEHGADVNALPATYQGVTALQAASINGMVEMAIRLLELGADVSARAAVEEGRTAINGAAERGRLEMVQVLLNAYGEQNDIRMVCNQAAYYAEKEDHVELVQWLREYPTG